MAKHILIDSYFGLVRTAISQGGKLLDYYEESPEQGRSKGNIYKGIVKKVDSHIQAAFVRYGGGRDGFLPLRDVSSRSGESGDAEGAEDEEGGRESGQRSSLKPGASVLVQVVKDEVGGKGAALTTKLSLSGRYLVYLPVRGGEGGITSRVSDEDRAALKKSMSELQIPPGGCVILRTAALNKTTAELQADLDRLDEAYREIREQGATRKEPGLVYREAPPALRYLREYYMPDVERIHVNEEDVLEQCRQFFNLYEPKAAAKVVLSPDGPLMFQKLGLEAEVERLSARKVPLPSGANFVIDQTEALVAIDVNSAKSGGGAAGSSGSRGDSHGSGRGDDKDGEEERGDGRRRRDLEETVFAINMEAAGEIARQLRLRDLGGIIVVDFIDMEEERHRRKVEEAMRRALAPDKAKIKVFDITPLGIMQISRQRLRKAGPHFSRTSCESCQGRGWHASPAAAAFSVLRRMEEKLQSRKGYSSLAVTAPYPVANHLLNEFRRHVLALEERHGAVIRILADPAPAGEPAFSIQSIEGGDGKASGAGKAAAEDVVKSAGGKAEAAEPRQKGRGRRGRAGGRSAPEAVSLELPVREGTEAADVAAPRSAEPVAEDSGKGSGFRVEAGEITVAETREYGEAEAPGVFPEDSERTEAPAGGEDAVAGPAAFGNAEPAKADNRRREGGGGGGKRSRRGRGRKGGRDGRAGDARPQAEPQGRGGKQGPVKGTQADKTAQGRRDKLAAQDRGGRPDGGKQVAQPAPNAGKEGQGRSKRRGRHRPRQGGETKEPSQPVAPRSSKGPIEY
jgi:ribonuclease E